MRDHFTSKPRHRIGQLLLLNCCNLGVRCHLKDLQPLLPATLTNHPSITFATHFSLPFGAPTTWASPCYALLGPHHVGNSTYKSFVPLQLFSSTCTNHLSLPFCDMCVTMELPALSTFTYESHTGMPGSFHTPYGGPP